MFKIHILQLSILLSLLFTSSLFAGVCIEINTSKDQLDDRDRKSAKIIIEGALQEEGRKVVQGDCSNKYSIYHLKLGETVTVIIDGPTGTKKNSVKSLNELPKIYSQMIRSLISKTNVNSTQNLDRYNATDKHINPRRAKTDSLFIIKLGFVAPVRILTLFTMLKPSSAKAIIGVFIIPFAKSGKNGLSIRCA